MNVTLGLNMIIELTQRDFATGAAVRKMNALAMALSDLAQNETDDDAAISTISSGLSNTTSSVSTISSGLSNTNSSVSSISTGLGNIIITPPSGADISIDVPAGGSNQFNPSAHVTKGTLQINPASVVFPVTTGGQVVSEDGKTLTNTTVNGGVVEYVADPVTGVITVSQTGTVEQLGYAPYYTIADMEGNATGGNIYTTITE